MRSTLLHTSSAVLFACVGLCPRLAFAVDAQSLRLVDEASGARAIIAVTSDGRLSWQLRAAGTPDDHAPDELLFVDAVSVTTRRGTFDPASTAPRPPHYLRLDDVDAWSPAPGPAQVLLCPWPRERDLLTSPGVTLTRDEAQRIASIWSTSDTPGVLRRVAFAYDGAGTPTSIIATLESNGQRVEGSTQTWRVTSVRTDDIATADLEFVPTRWQLLRFDPQTGKIFNADGTIGGGEINTSIAGLTDHIERERATSFASVAHWGGVACVLLVLGVGVDMIRRRL